MGSYGTIGVNEHVIPDTGQTESGLEDLKLAESRLAKVLREYGEVAVAFSGGVDSAYLLYAASKYCRRTAAYIVKSDFQPGFEFEDAEKVIGLLRDGPELKAIDVDVLTVPEVAANPENRCYYCKKAIFGEIIRTAGADGFTVVADGTNASDEYDDRPGMKAIIEMGVVSPLREAGLTKSMIRQLSAAAGLPTATKPSYACLATRIPHGTRIEKWMLERTEEAEKFMMEEGLRDFRVRLRRAEGGWSAGLEMSSPDLERYHSRKEVIDAKLLSLYDGILPEIKMR